jgi:hypothetical protein
LIGCATLKGDNDGPDRGVMLKPLSYSGKTVVSIEKWNEAINKQINYVKNLPGKGGVWAVAGGHQKGTTGRLLGGDHVKKLPGVGKITTAQLALVGIRTVGELLAMTPDKRKQLANLAKWTKTKIDGDCCPNAAEQQSTEQQQPPPPNQQPQQQQQRSIIVSPTTHMKPDSVTDGKQRKDNNSDNWGGKRVRKPDEDWKAAWLHPDAASALLERAEWSAKKFADATAAACESEDEDVNDGECSDEEDDDWN